MAKQSFKRFITKLFQVAGVRVETDFNNMQDNDFVVISRNNSAKTSSRQTVGDAQFYLRWDDFVAFLQGATTDQFVNSAVLVGTTINFGYNTAASGFAVNLDPLGIITAVSFSGTEITFTRPGTNFVLDIGEVLNSAVVGAVLVGTVLRFTLGNTSTFDVELSSLIDGVVTGGSLSGDNLVLTRSLGGDVPNIDISNIKDGVVTSGTVVSGQFLRLSRSLGGDVPDIDLSSATNAGVVLTFNATFTRAQLDAMSSSNRFNFFGLEFGNSFHVISYAVELTSGTNAYGTDISLILSYGTTTAGVDIASRLGWSTNPNFWAQTSDIKGTDMDKTGNRILHIHHNEFLGGDIGDYSLKVTILYASIP